MQAPERTAPLPTVDVHGEQTLVVDLGLGHRYRLNRLLSRSTCGDLWQATWVQTEAPVTLKTLRADLTAAELETHTQALQTEGEHLRHLAHRHIVRYQRSGQWDGAPVLVMERLHESLRDWLARHANARGVSMVPASQAQVWAHQAAQALQALHRSGRKHLDLKPANLLLGPPDANGRQVLKLADFGACLPLSAAEHGFVGTPGWAAPEQVQACTAGPDQSPRFCTSEASDWYALGQLMHRLLTGRLSPEGEAALGRFQAGGLIGLQTPGIMSSARASDARVDDTATWLGHGMNPLCDRPSQPPMPPGASSHVGALGDDGLDNVVTGLLSASPRQRLATAACWLQAPPPI